MEPALSLAHGLDVSIPDVVLSTAPASPTDDLPAMPYPGEASATTVSHTLPPQHSTLAQLSFGPATQQIITTVTTTTTVSLPPLVINPPKDLFERDPKQYPLAFSPTPQSIKRFCFDVNGRPTTFHESEDPKETMRRHHQLQARIRRNNGMLRQEEKDEYRTPVRELKQPQLSRQVFGVRASNAPKRTATTPSIAEAAELASLERKSKKPRSQLHRTHSEIFEHASLNQRAAAGGYPGLRTLSPVTPNTDNGVVEAGQLPPPLAQLRPDRRARICPRLPQSRLQELQGLNDSEDDERQDSELLDEYQGDDSHLGPPFYGKRPPAENPDLSDDGVAESSQSSGARATPPIVDGDLDPINPPVEYRRPRLPNILTTSNQDASLPSPSLSPITAAANAASRMQNAFDTSFAEHVQSNPNLAFEPEVDDGSKTQSANSQASTIAPTLGSQSRQATHSGPTIMDIPTLVDAFDSMPEAMQTYIMYQFLRRSAKPTLQMVASVVNPALKCDPFNVLPPELGLNITRFLDFQSMCRAAQVSKRWRRLINSDEKAWKDLLDRDEFALPPGEIARAVREGWGWQHPGGDGYEEDLTRHFSPSSPELVPMSEAVSEDDEIVLSTAPSRSRRKVKQGNSKRSKRRSAQAASTAAKPTPTISQWRRLLASAQGPNAFANAASHAIPHPSVGLPSLKNMHLFKSLYQRHHLIRKSWMMEDSQPQHLAFRAHHRHVVTCLLFDGDKILTGSDDTKINVYDTKTGALRNRLEGHEGGVWALQYDGDTLVSGSTDRSVRVWDIKSGRNLQTFQGHTSTVRCLVILQPVQIGTEADGTPVMMPKEPLIITGSRDSTLRVWKLPKPGDRQIFQTGPPANDHDNPYFIRTLSGHHNSVRAIAAYGDTLISGSYDCTVRVWKISTGDLLHRLQGHSQKVYSVVLDAERDRCISGSMDNLVKVWSLDSGSCLYNLEGHTSLVGLLDLSADRLVSAAADSTLRIWDPETGQCRSTLSAHTGAITCFQHDGQKVISGSDRTLKMWNVRTGEWVRDLLTELSGVWQVRFDERRVVAAVQRDNLTYIEVSAGFHPSMCTWLLLTLLTGSRLWCRSRRRPARPQREESRRRLPRQGDRGRHHGFRGRGRRSGRCRRDHGIRISITWSAYRQGD